MAIAPVQGLQPSPIFQNANPLNSSTSKRVAVSGSNTSVVTGNSRRSHLLIKNTGADSCHVTCRIAATTSHFLLSAGEGLVFNGDGFAQLAWNAISTGSSTLEVLEGIG